MYLYFGAAKSAREINVACPLGPKSGRTTMVFGWQAVATFPAAETGTPTQTDRQTDTETEKMADRHSYEAEE